MSYYKVMRRVLFLLLFLIIFGGMVVAEKVCAAETNGSDKHVEVDLTLQKIYTYEYGQRLKVYTISSGTAKTPTPTGVFKIWIKLASHKMEGGSKLTKNYYYLPNVPYIMYFNNDKYPKKYGLSLHGTYWHNNFGVPMSHGCVNMKTADAAELFNWVDIGTEVRIYGKYQYKKTVKK